MRILLCVLFTFLCSCTVSPPDPAEPPAPPPPLTGHWAGALQDADGPTALALNLEYNSVGWWGTLDMASWDPPGKPLDEVLVTADQLHMAIGDEPDRAIFDARLHADRLEGTMTRQLRAYSFWLNRSTAPIPLRPPRTQTPTAPLPYAQKRITFPSGDAVLAGTLTIPDGPGPHPALLLLAGTGPHTRDYSHHGHKMFWVLADVLSRAGYAVLRVDDRGTGESTGQLGQATIPQRTADALAAVAFLTHYPRLGPIGLIGHSQGCWTAAETALQSADVKLVVLLAAPGLSGREIYLAQRSLFGKDFSETNSQAATRPVTVSPEDWALQRSPEVVSFLHYDPAPTLARLRLSVLALEASKDRVLDSRANLLALQHTLHTPDTTLRWLPDLNHFMQPAQSGDGLESGSTPQTLAPEFLTLLQDWLAHRFAH